MDSGFFIRIIIDVLKAGARWAFVVLGTWLVKYQLLTAGQEQEFTPWAINWALILISAAVPIVWKFISSQAKWNKVQEALNAPAGTSLQKLERDMARK